MCKKQTSVSHSSTESEIISLDGGLRLDGFPHLIFGDLIVTVLGNTTQNHDRTGTLVVASWGETHESLSCFFHEKTQHVFVDEEDLMIERGNPFVHSVREARPRQFIIGNDETESELTMGSRSCLNRVE